MTYRIKVQGYAHNQGTAIPLTLKQSD